MACRLLLQLFELRNNLFLDASKLRELQWKKLKPLLRHAYENVPFYHQKFDQAKIKPEDIKALEDLRKIPLTTREELQKSPLKFITARNIDLGECVKTSTTGTTGMPFNIILDKRTVDYGNGLWFRTYERNGFRIWEKMAVIRHPNYFPKRYWFQNLGVMKRKYISVLDDVEHQIKALGQYQPDAVKSYSSSLVELARALKHQSEPIRPRLIFTGGELLDCRARSLISSSFGTEVFDTYGTMEFSLVAWECKAHAGYHINADCVLTEFLDGVEEVAAGERGEVVCTGLNNYAMPLIRYEHDDIAVPIDGECSCGVKLPLLKGIEGRENDFLMALDGRLISPWQFYPYPFDDYVGLKQFKVIQDRKDRLIFQLIIEDSLFDVSRLDRARVTIQKLFGGEMQVDFEIVDEFQRDKSGKMRVISRLF